MRAEDTLGVGIAEVFARLQDEKKLRMSDVRAVFWCGLRDHLPDLSVADAGTLMSALGHIEALEVIGKAIALSFPQVVKTDRPLAAGGRSQAGTGRRS